MFVFQGCNDNILAEMESSGGPLKAVHDLEEALWLVQEELAEEQRMHTLPRREKNPIHLTSSLPAWSAL